MLGRYRGTSKSFMLMNGAGSGALAGREITVTDGEVQLGRSRTFTCVVITIHGPSSRQDGYQVFFIDRQAGSVERQEGGSRIALIPMQIALIPSGRTQQVFTEHHALGTKVVRRSP